MSDAKSRFISNITNLRARLRITQVEAAVRIGVTSGTYQKYEYGTAFPTPETMDSIAKAYGVSVADLYLDREFARGSTPLKSDRILQIQAMLLKLNEQQIEQVFENLEQLIGDKD